jgi:putative tricarboxylic transport membrane protein
MGSTSAIIMLSGIYYGAMYGGTITSVLINTPGESSSVITCLDGYPMAQQGRAGAALGAAAVGSFFGGTVAILALVFIGPPLATFALRFGPPEFFSLLLLGLVTVIGLMGKSVLRGLIAAVFGLSLALVGIDPVTGSDRFTFGEPYLLNGIDLVSIAMGLFGFSEILIGMENLAENQKPPPKVQSLLPRRDEVVPMAKSIGRGTLLGCLIGLIPGTNGVIPTVISYSMEKKIAKDPSRFGKGAIEGVAGPETANNAYCGAALIPLFTLGIPSSPTIAVILGAFIMHGLTPGPSLFREQPDFVWAVIASMFIGNVILLVMNLPLANMWAKIATIPAKLLYPMILCVAVLGSFAIDNSIWSVGVMFTFGVVGYFMKKLDIPLAPIILTFVLGRLIETSLLQSLRMFNGSFVRIFERPISITLLTLATLMFLFALINGLRNKKDSYSGDTEI